MMASGFIKIIQSSTISFELLYDNSASTSHGALTFNLSDLSRYNCLAVYVVSTEDGFNFFPYLPVVPNNLNRWVVNGYGGGGTNCGGRVFTIDWTNNTLQVTNCYYNKGNQPSYIRVLYIYGIVGERLEI